MSLSWPGNTSSSPPSRAGGSVCAEKRSLGFPAKTAIPATRPWIDEEETVLQYSSEEGQNIRWHRNVLTKRQQSVVQI